MEQWKEYKISEVIDEISMGPFGSNIKVDNFIESGVPVLNGSNLQGYKLNENKFNYVSQEKADSLGKANAHRGDVVITHRGTLGQIVYIPKDSKFERYVISQSQFRLKLKENLIRPDFFVYFFHTRLGQHRILMNASQVGVPALARPTTTFKEVSIPIPSMETQNKVMNILHSLDDKIEINRQINDNLNLKLFQEAMLLWTVGMLKNDNLEQQAQALFKSWFVDFEPFKDGEFEESEIGMIPKGWRVLNYDEIIDQIISGDWGKERLEGNYTHKVACIRGCDFQDIKNGLRGKTPERFILEKNYQNKHFKDKDILVEISGGTATVSTGRVCLVSQQLIEKFEKDIVCTNFCRLIRPHSGYSAYLYYSWIHKYNNKIMFAYENGTSGIKNFRIKDFTSFEPLLIPPIQIIENFQGLVDKIIAKMQLNGAGTQILSDIRDALLPRLMFGELNPSEIHM